MKTIFTALILIASMQFGRASATYYDGQSAAFVLIDSRKIEDLADGKATLKTAVKPPAFWCGSVGSPRIQLTDFPVALLAKIREVNEPAFLVFYSDREVLTDKKVDPVGTVILGGDLTYKVGILTTTKLYSLSEEAIELKADTLEWIEAYRKCMTHEDAVERNFYLHFWAEGREE